MMRDSQRKVKVNWASHEGLGSLLCAASKAKVAQEQGISENKDGNIIIAPSLIENIPTLYLLLWGFFPCGKGLKQSR